MSGEVLIKCENLWHIYPGGVEALRDVNLEIRDGDVVAVIGQNGSGKTTLVKHFNGLLKPTRGVVTVMGVDTRKKSVHELARYVGYVFQNPVHQLFANTVEEELAFGPRNLGLSEQEVKERVEEALEFFNLKRFRNVHPFSLSFPYKKLVAVASVYAMRPRIFVLDEPTTGQDHVGLRMIEDMILKLEKEGFTIVMVSHDMRLVAETAKRIIVMKDGEILADKTPREVFSDHRLMALTNLKPPQISEFTQKLVEKKRLDEVPETALNVDEVVEPLAKYL